MFGVEQASGLVFLAYAILLHQLALLETVLINTIYLAGANLWHFLFQELNKNLDYSQLIHHFLEWVILFS